MMDLFNQTNPTAPDLTSDQAALERAGKKQVLKVRLHLAICYFYAADHSAERMELLVGVGFLQRHPSYLGGYQRSIFCCVHQWRPCVRCLWLHHLCAGHTDDRCFNG
jgi:hypothetical protein